MNKLLELPDGCIVRLDLITHISEIIKTPVQSMRDTYDFSYHIYWGDISLKIWHIRPNGYYRAEHKDRILPREKFIELWQAVIND